MRRGACSSRAALPREARWSVPPGSLPHRAPRCCSRWQAAPACRLGQPAAVGEPHLARYDEGGHANAGARRVRRPRAGHAGRGQDARLSGRAFRGRGPAAGQQRQVVPGRAAGRDHRRGSRRAQRLWPGGGFAVRGRKRLGRGELPRTGEHLAARQRAGVRRLRHRRARKGLERLRRDRHAREDRGHPGQRSRLAQRNRCRPLQRPGNDLLRALDLQVRGSGAARRGSGADRARRLSRRLWLERRRAVVDRAAVAHPQGGRRRRPDAGQRLDRPPRRRGDRRGGGDEPGQPRRAGGTGRLPAGPARPQGLDRVRQFAALHRFEERRRHPAGQRAARRIRHPHRALGPSRPLPGERGGRRHLQRRDRQRARQRRAGRAGRSAGEDRPGAAQHGVPRAYRRRTGPARLGILRRASDLPARPHGRRAQHRWRRDDRPGARRRRHRCRQERARRRPGAQPGEARPRGLAGFGAAGGILLPLRPFQLRQARGADVQYQVGQDLVDGGRAAGAAWNADYRANRYHAPDDEYDPAWDWRNVQRQFELFYLLGRDLATSRDWPNWVPGDEFRRIRDESCAAPGGC